MFDKVTRKLAEKMGKSVQEAAAPIRKEVKQAADNKVDLWSKVLRFGILIFLFVDGTRRVVAEPRQETPPSTIVINNYMDGQNFRQRREGGQRPPQKKTGR